MSISQYYDVYIDSLNGYDPLKILIIQLGIDLENYYKGITTLTPSQCWNKYLNSVKNIDKTDTRLNNAINTYINSVKQYYNQPTPNPVKKSNLWIIISVVIAVIIVVIITVIIFTRSAKNYIDFEREAQKIHRRIDCLRYTDPKYKEGIKEAHILWRKAYKSLKKNKKKYFIELKQKAGAGADAVSKDTMEAIYEGLLRGYEISSQENFRGLERGKIKIYKEMYSDNELEIPDNILELRDEDIEAKFKLPPDELDKILKECEKKFTQS